jgi:hypothetical protein
MVASVTITKNGPNAFNVLVVIGFDSQTFVTVDVDSNIRSLLPGNQRNNPDAIVAAASDWLQMLVDAGPPGHSTRQLLSTWDPLDPARIIDPALPYFFHARVVSTLGTGGNQVSIYRPVAIVGGVATHIIGRPFLATFVFNGTDYFVQVEVPPRALR